MGLGLTHVNSDQLELFTVREMRVTRIPWEGRSLRSLTKVALSGIFQSREKKCMSELISPAQLELWPSKKGPAYGGAPSLVPLPGGQHG